MPSGYGPVGSEDTAGAMLQMMDDEGPPVLGGYALAALAADNYPGDETAAAFVRNIAARQLPDGTWHSAGAPHS